jgi:ribonuclease-3
MVTNDTPDSRPAALQGFLDAHDLTGLTHEDLDLALTHRSYAYENNLRTDNERLEFLGDAIIAAVTAEYLFEADPEADEGMLSKRRARLVSRGVLGSLALEIGLGQLILLGRGERETGGARRVSTLGSALEAVVGIVYLRLGFARARGFLRRSVLDAVMESGDVSDLQEDYKSVLQEWSQQQYKCVPVYSPLAEEGPDHDKRFHVQVSVDGRVLAEGRGRRIKFAENDAARLALETTRRESQP